MTAASPRQKRRLWWFNLGVVLAVTVLWWWYQPVRDPRFVGKWEYDAADDNSLMYLNRDGTARWNYGLGQLHFEGWWRLDGDILRLDPDRNEFVSWIRRGIESFKAGRLVPRPRGFRLFIVDVSEEVITGYQIYARDTRVDFTLVVED